MFNFSGVLYRIWGVCGVILVLRVACILLDRPWAKKVKIKDCKLGLIMIAAAIGPEPVVCNQDRVPWRIIVYR